MSRILALIFLTFVFCLLVGFDVHLSMFSFATLISAAFGSLAIYGTMSMLGILPERKWLLGIAIVAGALIGILASICAAKSLGWVIATTALTAFSTGVAG
jgi:hypothetical protein